MSNQGAMEIETVSCPSCRRTGILPGSACPQCGYWIQLTAKSNKIAKTLLLIFGVIICVIVLGLGGRFAVFRLSIAQNIRRSAAFDKALQIAHNSAKLRAVLGDDFQTGSVSGAYVPYRGSEFDEWSVKLRSARGSGNLYAVANQVRGVVDFSKLVFVSDNDTHSIDIAPSPARLDIPEVPAKSVYLIPLDSNLRDDLSWAPAFYRSKFGLDLTVLPAAQLDPTLQNHDRHQYDAIKLAASIRETQPALANDPSAILIGVTSQDMYISSFDWAFAENFRSGDRVAVISSSRLHSEYFWWSDNPELWKSRLQKLISKNLALLYFDIPLSDDFTSLVSSAVRGTAQIDLMGPTVIGTTGQWQPLEEDNDPIVTVYDLPGKAPLWRIGTYDESMSPRDAQVSTADMSLGLFTYRKTEFRLDDKLPFEFARVYRNQDDAFRSFGIGGNDSFDICLVGQMGHYIELVLEDGARVHYNHAAPKPGDGGDTYRISDGTGGAVYGGSVLHFSGGVWRLVRRDGWTLTFDYRPNWPTFRITVLSSMIGPGGQKYILKRDEQGALLSVVSPAGDSLTFTEDAHQRIQSISSSDGSAAQYQYDDGGRLVRTLGPDGHTYSYTYDQRGEMLTAVRDSEAPSVTNAYSQDGYLISQALPGNQNFKYSYSFGSAHVLSNSLLLDPAGLVTFFEFNGGVYLQSLRTAPPH